MNDDEKYNPEDDIVAELAETVRTLAEENDALKDRLATEVMDGTLEEKAAALETITALRAEIHSLTINLNAVITSRDICMRELSEVKRQCIYQRRQLKKLGANA